ncbi:hypothetical protein LSH36_1254g00048 [Paralvinella palmiformis]|uniref:Uncharacterized protein n=1 Tax=Paralvinella palmiformis TaxID=53620 RepID=A0AAD9ITP4_9ANNE|nr:hypothetical protein LSH36_1254g00048 [Paralvinella palmiformis]
MDTSTKSWKDESCTTGLRNFICETYTPPTTTTTTTTAATTGSTATPGNKTTPPTGRPIYTTTRTRISGETTVATAGNDTRPGSAGASTDNGSGLSILEIVLIVMCILLLILIIVLIILVFYFKKRNNRRNKIGYDIRTEASVPNNEAMREEVYLPSEEVDDKSLGSQTDLIKQNGLISNRRPLPNIKINGDVR